MLVVMNVYSNLSCGALNAFIFSLSETLVDTMLKRICLNCLRVEAPDLKLLELAKMLPNKYEFYATFIRVVVQYKYGTCEEVDWGAFADTDWELVCAFEYCRSKKVLIHLN